MIYYTTSTGHRNRYPTAHLALVNWFVDTVIDEHNPVVNVASGHHFIGQVLAALERHHGRLLRIDRTDTQEAQCEAILRFIHATGGFKKFKITRRC